MPRHYPPARHSPIKEFLPLRFRLLLPLLLFCLGACQPEPKSVTVELTGHAVGTSYSLSLVDRQGNFELPAFQKALKQLFRQAKYSLSTYHSQSELNRINRAAADTLVPVSPQLHQVLAEGIRLNKLTRGSLDISLAPLSALWGFGADGVPEQIPSTSQLAATSAITGMDKLQLTDEGIRKSLGEVQLDLNTIGKGHVVDQIAVLAEEFGLADYKIELGDEQRLKGRDGRGAPWQIEILNPLPQGTASEQVIYPGNNAIATTGDLKRYFERDGVRYSHILDPATGRPISHKLASVTVLHPSGMTADGLATALMVMGPEAALKFAEQHQLAVHMISRAGDSYTSCNSSAFARYLEPERLQ